MKHMLAREAVPFQASPNKSQYEVEPRCIYTHMLTQKAIMNGEAIHEFPAVK